MASIPDLPLWGWNLIIAMQRHEDLHGTQDTCLNGVLNAVPADVRQQADAISSYIQKASGHQIADDATEEFGKIMDGFFGKPEEQKQTVEATP
ncbi:hypothetical protein [Streptomyces europaeiscabiei]|uniref:hypothetical protein n=1 Tax=Streptomyces europaeiscabiei TaxID=146819 RepID=UPI0029A5EE7F|nr:hypothetical protein [Streptomyces europaeiscabiei]MDX2757892.1 hypothetical protein [Streptomyces europaeiscabiei]